MSIGSTYTETTDTLYNAGGDVKFVDFIMECDVTRSILTNNKLQLTVFDENVTRKDAFLGQGSISLRKLAAALGNKIDIPVPLSDEKGAVCGNAVIKCILLPGSVNTEPLISDDSIVPLGIHRFILSTSHLLTFTLYRAWKTYCIKSGSQ